MPCSSPWRSISTQLEFPEADANELAQIFRKSGYTVDLPLGKEATRGAIKAKLEEIDEKGDSDGVVVLGYFGHGIEFEFTKLAVTARSTRSSGMSLMRKGGQVRMMMARP